MSARNVERVRRYYESWNAGDTDAVIAALASDVEWHGHPALPEPGPYHDRDSVRRWMRQFREAWGELQADPVVLLDAEDSVVALVHMTGRGRGSGVEVRGGVDIHVMTFDGEEVSYFGLYPGDVAAERAGLSDDEREVLILRVQEGMDESAIAERLGADDSRVIGRLEGAFEKLRAMPSRAHVS
ncbi:MAG TPA: nuclear transport factor 2 family protein [Solirubrobacterales bacterium]